jgi:hypothetical protein
VRVTEAACNTARTFPRRHVYIARISCAVTPSSHTPKTVILTLTVVKAASLTLFRSWKLINSFPTSQRTQSLYIIKTSRLVLFRSVVGVCCEKVCCGKLQFANVAAQGVANTVCTRHHTITDVYRSCHVVTLYARASIVLLHCNPVRRHCTPPKRRYLFTNRYSITSQKT